MSDVSVLSPDIGSFTAALDFALAAEAAGSVALLILGQDRSTGFDPLVLATALATVTRRIRLIVAASAVDWHPYNLARGIAALDHISDGRAGWLATLDSARDEDAPTRVARAAECVAVLRGLLASWERDAFPRDKAAGLMFDLSRMRRLDHRGRFYAVRGPLDTEPPPQDALPIYTVDPALAAQATLPLLDLAP